MRKNFSPFFTIPSYIKKCRQEETNGDFRLLLHSLKEKNLPQEPSNFYIFNKK